MGITDAQRVKAEKLRELVDVQGFSDVFMAFDFIDAIAVILDGVENLTGPQDMAQLFNAAWHSYAAVTGSEHGAAILAAVGGDVALWNRIKEHPKGREAVSEILTRIQAVHGHVKPRMEVDVNVSDILLDHQIS